MMFHLIRSFITSEISSFALLIGRTIFLHSEILSFVFLIGYIKNQHEFYLLSFSWINLSTYEISLFYCTRQPSERNRKGTSARESVKILSNTNMVVMQVKRKTAHLQLPSVNQKRLLLQLHIFANQTCSFRRQR